MDPITAIAFWVVVSMFVVSQLGHYVKKKPAQPVKAIAPIHVSSDEHRLVKTWINITEADGPYDGWRYKCSCGHRGSANNCTKTSLGSEHNAIGQFKVHAKGFREANHNPDQEKYDKLQDEFDAFKKRCYCQETHTDIELLDLKG